MSQQLMLTGNYIIRLKDCINLRFEEAYYVLDIIVDGYSINCCITSMILFGKYIASMRAKKLRPSPPSLDRVVHLALRLG